MTSAQAVPLPEAERPHVGPDLLDKCEALLLRAAPPRVRPARRIPPVGEPDRILALAIDDHPVNCRFPNLPLVHRPTILRISCRARPTGSLGARLPGHGGTGRNGLDKLRYSNQGKSPGYTRTLAGH